MKRFILITMMLCVGILHLSAREVQYPDSTVTLKGVVKGARSSYLDYVRCTIRFKCDWTRRLFSSAYTAVSEMVTVDLDDRPDRFIPSAEAYGHRHYFSDNAPQNWDTDFWADYNIIEPSESLEKAVARLRRKQGL